MISFFLRLFDTSDFPPRWHCGTWSAGLGWLHILSDIAIFGAYAAIPMALTFFIKRRKDVPFAPIFWLFSGFIIFCGLSHLVEATMFWNPWYRLSGLVKALTALISWMTVVALIKTIPDALALPGMAKVNQKLSEQIAERSQAETALSKSEEFNRTVIQSSPDCVKVLDANGFVELLNDSGRCLLEIDDEKSCLGKHWWDLWPEEARKTVQNAFSRAKTGEIARFEEFCPTVKGTPKWWDVQVSPVRNSDGSIDRLVAVSRDMTERRQVDESLREQKHFLERITRITPDVLYVLNINEMKFNWISSQSKSKLGYSPDQIMEMGADFMPSVMHPDDFARMAGHFAELGSSADGETLEIEYRLRHPDGEWRWFEGRKTPFSRDAKGRVREIMGTSVEITERKKAEQRASLHLGVTRLLAETGAEEDGLPKLLEVVGGELEWDFGAIWLVDESSATIQCHDVWYREVAGMESFVEASLESKFGRGVGLPGRVWANPTEALWIRDVVADGNFQRLALAADAELHAACAFPILVEKGCIGIIEFFCHEIQERDNDLAALLQSIGNQVGQFVERRHAETDLRRSESSYRSLFESPGVGRAEAHAHTGRLMRANQSYCDLFGFSEEELLDGKTLSDLTHPEDRERNTRTLEPLVSGIDTSVELEERCLRKDGSTIWVSISVSVLPDGGGQPETLVATVHNITERKKAEEQLRIFESAIQKMNDVVLITEAAPIDPPGPRIRYVNPAFTTMTGYTADEAIGQTPRILQGPKTNRATLDTIRQNLKTFQPVKVELTNYRKDGTEFEVEFEIVPVADEIGRITHLVSVQRDITDRKRTEEALRQNAHLFSEIIDQAPGGVFVVDAQFQMRQINDGARPVFANAEPIIGRDLEEVLEILWGSEVGRQCSEIFRHTLETGEIFVSPRFTERRHDINEEQSYEWQTQQITLPDGQCGVVCYFEDVTDRIKAEEERQAIEQRMRIATEATQVGIWEWNVITGQVRWDAQMFRIYGIKPTPEGDVSYKDWNDSVLPEDLPENEAILQETVRNCGQSSREFRIRRRDDEGLRIVHCVETVRKNAEGEAEWVIGTNLDVTEQRRAEQAILDEAKRKDEFLAMLGHELRNPLNAIRHAVEISSETPDDKEACRWADQVVDRQSQQLSRMVDDLLDVARINRGRIELRLESLDLAAVLDRAVSVVSSIMEERQHDLDLEIGKDLVVTGDAARLEQVFVNLLNNAAKYTPVGGQINLAATKADDRIVVSVTDNGIGIAPELLPQVCDLFRQADSTLDRAEGGLGIGLSVVKSLVEMHGGHLSIESRGIDLGTIVKVRLPHSPHIQTASDPAGEAETESIRKGLKVLIVDDHEDAAHGLGRLLKRRDCEVRIAYTGPEGLQAAREFNPEILLLDLGLPELDGFELVRTLKSDSSFKGACFIAISGYALGGDRDRCLEAGFNDHFAKPIDFPALLAAIRRHCLA